MNNDEKKTLQEFKRTLKKAKKTFPAHKELIMRIKENAVNPFGSSIFETFLRNQKTPINRKKYNLYIHLRDNYMRFSTSPPDVFEDIRLPIDNLLWIEIYYTFKVIKIEHSEEEVWNSIYCRVKPHLY